MDGVFFSSLQPNDLELMIEKALSRALMNPDRLSHDEAVTGSEVLNIDEAASFLRLPKNTLYGYASQQKIPYCKPGKTLVFLKADLIEWLKKHRRRTRFEILADAADNLAAANRSSKK